MLGVPRRKQDGGCHSQGLHQALLRRKRACGQQDWRRRAGNDIGQHSGTGHVLGKERGQRATCQGCDAVPHGQGLQSVSLVGRAILLEGHPTGRVRLLLVPPRPPGQFILDNLL